MGLKCAECATRPAETNRYFCVTCITEYVTGLRRRREAERRLPVLDQVSR